MPEKTLPNDWKERVTKYLDSRKPAIDGDMSDFQKKLIEADRENKNRLLETEEVARAARYIWGETARRPEIQQESHKIIGDAVRDLSQTLGGNYRLYQRSRKERRAIAEALETVRDDGLFFTDNYRPGPFGEIEEKIKFANLILRDTLNRAITYYRKQVEEAATKTKPRELGQSDALYNLLGLCRTWGFEGRVRNEIVMLFINAGAKAFPSAFARINKRTISVRASEIKKNPLHWRY